MKSPLSHHFTSLAQRLTRSLFACLLLAGTTQTATAASPDKKGNYCGVEGNWIQILGSGGAELDDRRAGTSYLVWIDGKAKLLIDAGPGAAVRFDEAGAKLEDLDAIIFTQLQSAHTSDLIDFITGAQLSRRDRPLPVYGPDGNDVMPSTSQLLNRLIGPGGAYPLLADYLTFKSGGFRVKAHNVNASGIRPGTRFTNEHMRLSTIPVSHGPIPALAWRVQLGDQAIVFTGDFNNRKDRVPDFAKDSDALVVSHTIPEVARGAARDLHLLPSQIGRIAKQAGVRMVILGQRMNRTRGRESQTREAINRNYEGALIYSNELECWGL